MVQISNPTAAPPRGDQATATPQPNLDSPLAAVRATEVSATRTAAPAELGAGTGNQIALSTIGDLEDMAPAYPRLGPEKIQTPRPQPRAGSTGHRLTATAYADHGGQLSDKVSKHFARRTGLMWKIPAGVDLAEILKSNPKMSGITVIIGAGKLALGMLVDKLSARTGGKQGVAVYGRKLTPAIEALIDNGGCYSIQSKTAEGPKTAIECGVTHLGVFTTAAGMNQLIADVKTTPMIVPCMTSSAYELTDEQIAADAAGIVNQQRQALSAIGHIAYALYARYKAGNGLQAPVLMPAENIFNNGDVFKAVLCRIAEQLDPGFHRYMQAAPAINTAVDRICEATGKQGRVTAPDGEVLDDSAQVWAERYPGMFVAQAGDEQLAQLDLPAITQSPFLDLIKAMKARLLNAMQITPVLLAQAVGKTPVKIAEIYHDATMGPLLDDVRARILDSIDPLPGIDKHRYAQEIHERLSDLYEGDPVARIGNWPGYRTRAYLLPALAATMEKGIDVKKWVAIVAASLEAIAQCPREPLSKAALIAQLPEKHRPAFAQQLEEALRRFEEDGIRHVLLA